MTVASISAVGSVHGHFFSGGLRKLAAECLLPCPPFLRQEWGDVQTMWARRVVHSLEALGNRAGHWSAESAQDPSPKRRDEYYLSLVSPLLISTKTTPTGGPFHYWRELSPVHEAVLLYAFSFYYCFFAVRTSRPVRLAP